MDVNKIIEEEVSQQSELSKNAFVSKRLDNLMRELEGTKKSLNIFRGTDELQQFSTLVAKLKFVIKKFKDM
jgi:hypothetical protein